VYLLTFSHICTINYFVISACFCALVFVFEFSGSWEIPFEEISDLSWLGSGAQGAVFLGRLNGQQVAVKKVHNANETDILHLRKLSHPNIIKFKFVYFAVIFANLPIRLIFILLFCGICMKIRWVNTGKCACNHCTDFFKFTFSIKWISVVYESCFCIRC